MKRHVASVVAALVLASGALGVTTSSAGADPYPGSVPTRTHLASKHKIKVGHRYKVRVYVSDASNLPPTGSVDCVIKRQHGGFRTEGSKAYSGQTVKFKTRKLGRGKYKVKCSYTPTPGSIFLPSSAKHYFKVKRRFHNH